MYFALNNNDAYAIKRLQGASTRYALGETERAKAQRTSIRTPEHTPLQST
jgi:hypothetical protein